MRSHEDLARRFIDAHNHGAEAVLAGYDEFLDPEFEWCPAVVGGLEENSYRGYEGVRRYYADRDEAFEDSTIELVSLSVVAGDLLVLHIRSRGRGRASGAGLDEEVGLVWRLRDGRILKSRAYTSHAEALAAASEEATVDA